VVCGRVTGGALRSGEDAKAGIGGVPVAVSCAVDVGGSRGGVVVVAATCHTGGGIW